MNPILLFGEMAREEALKRASSNLMGDVNGLTAESVKEAIELLGSYPPGRRTGFVVLGPLDAVTTNKVADKLLIVLESGIPDTLQPILWAIEEANVPLTIRSRCLLEFVSRKPDILSGEDDGNESLFTAASDLYTSYRNGTAKWESALILTKLDKRGSDITAILSPLIDLCYGDHDWKLWDRLRGLTQQSVVCKADLYLRLTQP